METLKLVCKETVLFMLLLYRQY